MEERIRRWAAFWPAWLVLAVPFLYFWSEPFTVAVHQAVAVPLFFLLAMGGSAVRPGTAASGWFFRACLAWLALLGLSAVRSVDPTISVPFFLKVIGLAAIAGSIRWLGDDRQIGPPLFAAAALAGVLHGWQARLEYLEAAPIPASWVDPEMKGLIPTRCAGLFSDPNIFGAYLAALLPFTLGGIFANATHPWRPYAFGAGFFGAAVGLLTTFSRTGYLAGLLSVAVFLIVRRPERRLTVGMKVFLAATALVGLVFLMGPFRYRLLSIANPSDMTTSQRALINRGIWRALDRIPLTGFGLHTFSMVYPQFRIVGGDYPFNAHNEFLHTLVEAGPLAMVALAVLCGLLGWQIVRLWRQPGAETGEVAAAGAAAWAGLALQNLGGFSARIFPTAVLIAVATGLVVRSMSGRRGTAAAMPLPSAMVRVMAGLGLIIYLVLTFRHLHVQLRIEQAQAALQAGRPAEARHLLEGIIGGTADHPGVVALLARLDEQGGDLAGAQARWAEAARLNPQEAVFWAEQSRLAARTGQGDPLALMERAVALDPASELYRLQMARLLAGAGRPLEALVQLDEALRTSPNYDEVYTTYQAVKEYRRELLGAAAALGASDSPDLGGPLATSAADRLFRMEPWSSAPIAATGVTGPGSAAVTASGRTTAGVGTTAPRAVGEPIRPVAQQGNGLGWPAPPAGAAIGSTVGSAGDGVAEAADAAGQAGQAGQAADAAGQAAGQAAADAMASATAGAAGPLATQPPLPPVIPPAQAPLSGDRR
ncbi:MAG: O-antigen polymerase family protein [Candidatus Ozemobacter sibiricus]|uniref:O-antigen polymerase family protein n=1 Tax=Candidatus Ozemobacter sibiricus TaxID=2268124 RepID=A0A367ZIH1_9BACT|nr:MAG: O-antigen polymerase family protein [Candidatus Ozemobacter sibiricus]